MESVEDSSIISGWMVEVRLEDLEDIESCLIQVAAKQDNLCSSELLHACSRTDGDGKCSNTDVVRVMAELDNIKFLMNLMRTKLKHVLANGARTGQMQELKSATGLKRSRPLMTLANPPRLPGAVVAGCESGQGPDTGSLGDVSNRLEDSSDRSTMASKFCKVGHGSKGLGHGPQIYMPTAAKPTLESTGAVAGVGSDLVPANFVSGAKSSSGMKSPKKRPNRSRRDRNRARNRPLPTPVTQVQRLQPGESGKIPEDGYLWRKYGNKPIKTASYKRGYYKCRHFKEMGCQATKIVQQTNSDPTAFHVSYKGDHSCSHQLSGGHGSSFPSEPEGNGTLADQMRAGLISEDAVEMAPDTLEFERGLDWTVSTPDHSSADDADDFFPGDDGVESQAVDEPASPLLDFEIAQEIDIPSLPAEDLSTLDSAAPKDDYWMPATTPSMKHASLDGGLEPLPSEMISDDIQILLRHNWLSDSALTNPFVDVTFWHDHDVQSSRDFVG